MTDHHSTTHHDSSYQAIPLPRLAIFDMDGLLFDTERNMYEANTEVMASYGYEQNLSNYLTTLGMSGDNFLRQLHALYGPDYPAEKISRESFDLANQRIMRDGPPVKEGIPQLLSFLHSRKVPMCVASSTRSDTVHTYLEMAGIAHYFDFVIGGEMVTKSKPDPEMDLLCCHRAHAVCKDALVLEDSENGILAAHNAGIPVICIIDMKVPAPAYADMTLLTVRSAQEALAALLH